MSFSHNPLEHIEILRHRDDTGKIIGYAVYCHGCGGERPANHKGEILFDRHTTVETLFNTMEEHVTTSHARTAEDFKNWSIY